MRSSTEFPDVRPRIVPKTDSSSKWKRFHLTFGNRATKGLLCIFLVVPLFLIALPVANVASAVDIPRILIAGDDSDRDAVPRKSRAFEHVLNAISTGLTAEGIDDVKDETAALKAEGKKFPDSGKRRNVSQLIDVARTIGADLLVIFKIFWYVEGDDVTYRKIKCRVSGRILNVQSGDRLGNFTAENKRGKEVVERCDRECVINAVSDQGGTMAATIAEALRQKIESIYGLELKHNEKDFERTEIIWER